MKLSRRQAEVCELIAEGLTNKLIARRLGIAPITAKNHIAYAFKKLGATNRAHAAVIYRGMA